MRRSKLERYVAILAVLAHMGPLKLTHIMYKSNFNGNILKEYLDSLIKQGLVEERTIKKNSKVFCSNSTRLNCAETFPATHPRNIDHRRNIKSKQDLL
jgi:hypothetical protein